MNYYFVLYIDIKTNEINHFGHLDSGTNILWNNNPTLFKTYDEARSAIKRTETYAKKNKMPWLDYWYARIRRAVL